MNPEAKQLWISALKSREYEQGRGYLKAKVGDRKVSHCCLGVLSEVAAQQGVIPDAEMRHQYDDDDDCVAWYFGEDEEAVMLPQEVCDWAGIGRQGTLPTSFRHEESDYVIRTLWELNDVAEYSFEQIAQIIEEQF